MEAPKLMIEKRVINTSIYNDLSQIFFSRAFAQEPNLVWFAACGTAKAFVNTIFQSFSEMLKLARLPFGTSRPYPFKFFKGCLLQNFLSPLLDTLCHLTSQTGFSLQIPKFSRETNFILQVSPNEDTWQ